MPQSPTIAVGENLRRARIERQLSLASVAEQAGISVATLSRVETDKQNVDVALLLKIARILDVSAAELLGERDDDDDFATLARRVAGLAPSERARLFFEVSRRREKGVAASVEELLATLAFLRQELVNVQKSIRRRSR